MLIMCCLLLAHSNYKFDTTLLFRPFRLHYFKVVKLEKSRCLKVHGCAGDLSKKPTADLKCLDFCVL
jgi:hypothetical protein